MLTAQQKAASNGWIEWRGGKCPVASYAVVEVIWRDGFTSVRPAGLLKWLHHGSKNDIVGYKVIND